MSDLALPPSLAAELQSIRRRLDTLERSKAPINHANSAVMTLESTATGWVDLATLGPAVSLRAVSGRLLVLVSAQINLTGSGYAAVSFTITGTGPDGAAINTPASLDNCFTVQGNSGDAQRGSSAAYADVPPGSAITITTKYLSAAGTTQFSRRQLTVIQL